MADYYAIEQNIVHDLIEGEVILLNLTSGTYYQLKDSAVAVWLEIERGKSVAEIARAFALHYARALPEIERALESFVAELNAESILIPQNAAQENLDAALPADALTHLPADFSPPQLLKYTDMQSLLLLDPIHDVDTPGWPIKKQDETPA